MPPRHFKKEKKFRRRLFLANCVYRQCIHILYTGILCIQTMVVSMPFIFGFRAQKLCNYESEARPLKLQFRQDENGHKDLLCGNKIFNILILEVCNQQEVWHALTHPPSNNYENLRSFERCTFSFPAINSSFINWLQILMSLNCITVE